MESPSKGLNGPIKRLLGGGVFVYTKNPLKCEHFMRGLVFCRNSLPEGNEAIHVARIIGRENKVIGLALEENTPLNGRGNAHKRRIRIIIIQLKTKILFRVELNTILLHPRFQTELPPGERGSRGECKVARLNDFSVWGVHRGLEGIVHRVLAHALAQIIKIRDGGENNHQHRESNDHGNEQAIRFKRLPFLIELF